MGIFISIPKSQFHRPITRKTQLPTTAIADWDLGIGSDWRRVLGIGSYVTASNDAVTDGFDTAAHGEITDDRHAFGLTRGDEIIEGSELVAASKKMPRLRNPNM